MAEAYKHAKDTSAVPKRTPVVCNEETKMPVKRWEWLSLPKDENKLKQMWMGTRDQHPALKMAYDAIKMKRSPKQAFILLLGLSGAGKSSSINYLFEKEIVPTNAETSETRSSTEYIVSMKSDEWMIQDLSLSVIDTPGFCDTEGLEQDAKNMVCINDFLTQHCCLRGKFPNLVFLIMDIQDNRIDGSNSQFSKMLRGIAKLEAVDRNNQNLVVVLTHAASIATISEIWIEKVKQKTMKVKEIVLTHLGIKPKVVVQENMPGNYGLKKDGDWHILPNGAKQPKQLFETCKRILNTSKDELGHEAIAVCFRSGGKKNLYKGMELTSFNVTKDDVSTMHEILLQTVVAVSETEVSRMLDQYNKERNTPKLNSDILILKSCFQNANITEARDLESSSMNKIKAKMGPNLTSRMEKILEDVFDLKYKQTSGRVCPVGKGYNILKDFPTRTDPLVLGNNCVENLGFSENVLINKCCIYDVNCRIFKSRGEYLNIRLNDLSISSDDGINISKFRKNVREGNNIEDSSSNSTSVKALNGISFSIEQKTYKLSVKQPYKPSEDFKKDINSLPSQFLADSERNVAEWKRFFKTWGYHVVIGAYLGGSVTGQMRPESHNTYEKTTEDLQVELCMKLNYLSNNANFSFDKLNTDSTETTQTTDASSTTLKWIGGDESYFRYYLEQIGIEDWGNWCKSLECNPAPLWTFLDLYPINKLAEQVNQTKAREMEKAFSHAVGRQLKHQEPKEDNRDTVGQSNSSGDGCFPEKSTVFLCNGERKQMKDVLVGDQILTADNEGRIIKDEVIAWIHKVEECEFRFLKVSHEHGTITISDEHILYVGENKTPRHASTLQPGDKVYFTQNKRKMSSILVKVTLVENTKQTGLYAPLTRSGSLLVDGVFVSCYCTLDPISILGRQIVSAHDLAQLGFLPLRLAHNFGFNINRGKIDVETGIHQYAQWLMENALGCLKWINGTF